MSGFTEKTSKKIDMVFVLALITLFAATAFILVLIGAKQYRFITGVMSENFEDRTTSSYLSEKIRQADTADALSITYLNGTPALSILSTEGDIRYTTYIYYYEDALRELIVTENSVFSLSSGQEIIQLKGFLPELLEDSLIRAEITDTMGKRHVLYFTIHCSVGKEAS